MENPADLSLLEAAALIESGELTPIDLLRACIQRVEAGEPRLRAFVTIQAEAALKVARRLTQETRSDSGRGLLAGIPVAVKDLVDVEGLPTTASSRVLRDNLASSDATVVARLRGAGTTFVGKTNTQEFAYGVVTPPTCNPWDPHRIPGGSSGGSAVAVAAGMALAAVGSDTAGSIRIPAALCGISGLMPRPGRVPVDGIVALAPSLDRCGPLAHTVADLIPLFETMAGARVGDLPDARALRYASPSSLSAVISDLDAEVESTVDAAIDRLAEGAECTEVEVPAFEDWERSRLDVLMTEALEVHRSAGWYPQRAELYGEETLRNLKKAEEIDAERLGAAQSKLAELRARLLEAFNAADVLVFPTTPIAAPRHDEVARMPGAGQRTAVVRALTRITGPINCCELAALSIPCGFTEGGLPIGLQLVGRDEAVVLAAGLAYQERTDFHTRRPPAP